MKQSFESFEQFSNWERFCSRLNLGNWTLQRLKFQSTSMFLCNELQCFNNSSEINQYVDDYANSNRLQTLLSCQLWNFFFSFRFMQSCAYHVCVFLRLFHNFPQTHARIWLLVDGKFVSNVQFVQSRWCCPARHDRQNFTNHQSININKFLCVN